MKITKERLRQVIKEELEKVLKVQSEAQGWKSTYDYMSDPTTPDSERASGRLNTADKYRNSDDETYSALQELVDAVLTLKKPPIIQGRSREGDRKRVATALNKVRDLKTKEGFEDTLNTFAAEHDLYRDDSSSILDLLNQYI